jgi:hypothetical protein
MLETLRKASKKLVLMVETRPKFKPLYLPETSTVRCSYTSLLLLLLIIIIIYGR